jgi:hypothetical protein
MSLINPNPIYLVALDGTTWVPAVDNTGRADTTELIPPAGVSAIPWYELNDTVTTQTWRLVVQPCPSAPAGPQGELRADPSGTFNPVAPNQLQVSAPNGMIYALSIANGRLMSGLVTVGTGCNVPISVLANRVLERLEDPTGIFWSEQYEIYSAIIEAENELMLLVGRPTLTVQSPLNLVPNLCWQPMPKGLLAITDVYGPQSLLRKVSLFSMDYEQASWGSDWENDNSNYGPVRWAPIGATIFVVHPAAAVSQQVTINAVQYPTTDPWPYTGAEVVPFHDEFFVALEMYAAVYARLKEGGAELQTALPMLMEFYSIAERMTTIDNRRDTLVFSKSLGIPFGTNQIGKR